MRLARSAAALGVLAATAVAGCGSTGTVSTVTVDRTVTVLDANGAAAPDASTTDQAVSPSKGFDTQAIYAKDGPGVVTVVSIYSGSDALTGRGAEGSGFVIDDQGEIATNAHVVTVGSGSSIHKVAQVFVRFPNRNQVDARIVGFDPNEDVALLKVDPAGLGLQPLKLGSSEALRVGAPVAAIGSPFGEEGSMSTGIISATDRTIDSLTRFQISGAIQTDAAINHGNSGGPLVGADGSVVGINSQINSSSGDNSGVGFALPIDSVKRSLDQLRSQGHVDYAYLGVSSSSLYPQLATKLGLPVDAGAIIGQVVKGGPADRAGLKAGHNEIHFQGATVPSDSDVIVAVDGHPVRLEDDLGRILAAYRPGQVTHLAVVHGKTRRTVTVRLGSRPSTP